MEEGPSLTLKIGEREIELSHENTSLFTFLGKTAIGDLTFNNSSANHVFVETGVGEDDRTQGMYLFESFHPVYTTIASFIIEHELPIVGNQRTVPECDMRAYWNQADAEEAKFAARLQGVMPEDFRK